MESFKKTKLGGPGPEAFLPREMPLQHLALPGEDQVHVWFLDLRSLMGSLQHALSGEDDQDDSVEGDSPAGPALSVEQLRFARRFYLRLLLGGYLGVPGKDVIINRSNRGKPVLDTSVHSSSLQFSMAKSEGHLLVGVSASRQVGVDLEPAWRKAKSPLRLAKRYFSPAEYRALQALPERRHDEAFLRAWAINEAVVKASGLGIANQLCRFTLEMDPDKPPAVLDIEKDTAADWFVSLLRPSQDFIGAVASRNPQTELACFQLLPSR